MIEALLGIPLVVAIVLSASFVLSYILLGGLSSAIYNEVLQFFVILAGLIPLVVIAVKEVGGLSQLFDTLGAENGPTFNSAWAGTEPGGANAFGDFFGIIVGLGFCLSFGYWTTNFAEVQRAMAAKTHQRRPDDPDHRRLPQAVHPADHDPAGHVRAGPDPRARQTEAAAWSTTTRSPR